MSTSEFLLLYFAGFGLVLFLGWAAAMTYALDGDPRRARRSARIFAVLTVIHPLAAVMAWDLWRHADDWVLPGEKKVT